MATLQGLADLRESLVEFAREQILEDFRVERPSSVSVNAWQKQQSRLIDRAIARIQLCETVDELVNHAFTVLKPWNLEAFLYLHVSERAEEQPLSVPFLWVEATVHPVEDHRPLPAAAEMELLATEKKAHNEELESLFREEFGMELPKSEPGSSSGTRTRTFERSLKRPPDCVIEIE